MDSKLYTILIGAFVGWLLKMFFEYATGARKRNELARKAYFQLFTLLRQIESTINGVELFELSERGVTEENSDYWSRAVQIENYDRIRENCFRVLDELSAEAPKVSARVHELFDAIDTVQNFHRTVLHPGAKKMAGSAPSAISGILRDTRDNLIGILDLLDKQGRSFRVVRDFRSFDIAPEEPTMALWMRASAMKKRAQQDEDPKPDNAPS